MFISSWNFGQMNVEMLDGLDHVNIDVEGFKFKYSCRGTRIVSAVQVERKSVFWPSILQIIALCPRNKVHVESGFNKTLMRWVFFVKSRHSRNYRLNICRLSQLNYEKKHLTICRAVAKNVGDPGKIPIGPI